MQHTQFETARNRLATDSWFGLLDHAARQELLGGMVPIGLKAGEFLFRKGDRQRTFFALLDGTMKASTLREDGKEAVLAMLEGVTWFGEGGAIDGRPRIHDMAAVTSARLVGVCDAVFERLMQNASFAGAVARLQAHHNRAAYEMLEDATLHSTRARVARRLLRLARGDTTFTPAERSVIHVTHETLAMMLGISRQTLALELRCLTDRGAIAPSYGRIGVVSLAALESIELGS